MKETILAIDQSTSGTKALLFDRKGAVIARSDRPHTQKISDNGWVAHDPMEIYDNVITVVKKVVETAGIDKSDIAVLGISNQRETALVWDRKTGLPVYDAIVWQCARGTEICERIKDRAEWIKDRTGLQLSPYFSAAKIAWVLENVSHTETKSLCAGTVDSWLIYKLTGGRSFKTDYSNASRTQLFNISELAWDADVCDVFGIDPAILPKVCDSDSCFGETDFEGFLDQPIPIHAALGDSHGALFGQGCHSRGMIKATYGTGSSVMMNTGDKLVKSEKGLVTSLAWSMGGKPVYVLEGNINYTGSILQWLVDDVKLLNSPKESADVAMQANPEDTTVLVPAFTGLGAPYWRSDAKAMICGMGRTTGRAEIVRAAEESIAYQIADIVNLMREEVGGRDAVTELRVDGGPTRDTFLMQFQSDILDAVVAVPDAEELSGIGAAYAAGVAVGLYNHDVFERMERRRFTPVMDIETRQRKYGNWKAAAEMLLQR